MSEPQIVSREDWLKERLALLSEEKAFTRERDRLAVRRRALPLVLVEKDYQFDTADGKKSLSDLFGPHPQLAVYHFMFGETWEQGCPSCSYWADSFDGLDAHLAARDTAFAAISNAPLEKLEAYKKRMGWHFPWVSAAGSSFGIDFGVTFPGKADTTGRGYNYAPKMYGEEMPGFSTFLKLDDGRVGHSYSTFGRGIDILNTAYNILDLTPLGRHEEGLPHPMAWVRRHDMYGKEG